MDLVEYNGVPKFMFYRHREFKFRDGICGKSRCFSVDVD